VRREPRYDVPKKAPGSLRLVQEFLNTGDKEHGREWLDTAGALRGWLAERGLISATARITGADLERALHAREALREIVRANSGRLPDPAAIQLLHELADAGGITIRFETSGDVRLHAAAPGLPGALGRIIARAVEAAVEGRWQRLKACPNCSWAFYDYSPSRTARWCSMSLCGNRLKTRAYYRRVRDGAGTSTSGSRQPDDR
jgi:predicted RNA-binding Zn ribbon-like protein